MHAFDDANPPADIAFAVIRAVLAQRPRRIAFAGRAGSGKSTLCEFVSGTAPELAGLPVRLDPIPVVNHADPIKEEALEWLARARSRALIPGENATFEAFCDFMGLTPALVRHDLWEIVGPAWDAADRALREVYDRRLPVLAFLDVAVGEHVSEKVAFVEAHKPVFRELLQAYGQAGRELGGNPGYWAEMTVSRSLAHPSCLNGDTRYANEAELLRGAGWTVVHLDCPERELAARRPEMTPAQLAHVSERSIGPADCDFSLDAAQPVPKIAMDLADRLGAPARARKETVR